MVYMCAHTVDRGITNQGLPGELGRLSRRNCRPVDASDHMLRVDAISEHDRWFISAKILRATDRTLFYVRTYRRARIAIRSKLKVGANPTKRETFVRTSTCPPVALYFKINERAHPRVTFDAPTNARDHRACTNQVETRFSFETSGIRACVQPCSLIPYSATKKGIVVRRQWQRVSVISRSRTNRRTERYRRQSLILAAINSSKGEVREGGRLSV